MPAPPEIACLRPPDGAWLLASRRPRPPLAAYVRDYQGYEEFAASGVRRRELPHGGVVLVINFGAAWRVADPRSADRIVRYGSFVAGVDDFASLVDCAGRAFCLQVNFTPLGARRFFALPMRHLARSVVPLDDVLGADADRLADRLFQAAGWSERFDIVEQLIAARLGAAPAEDDGIAWAWRRIERDGGRTSIAALARQLECSRKHLLARFRDQIGLPPKTVAGIVRFNRALRLIGAAPAPDLARAAAAAGYYDQPHFNRDFLALAGITPGEYLRARLAGGDGIGA
ncbi:MAG: helix-turn-helix domain-containing protein [Reyranellaceae bacterium]